MSVAVTFIILVILMIIVAFLCLYFAKTLPVLFKYTPSIVLVAGILYLFVKLQLNLGEHAFDEIYDVLGIIFLSCTLVMALVFALVIEIKNRMAG
ncbi:hypothetical protein FIU87_02525 [Bacillus sp. THAF10]|uniref:hypothetical protein n=1 Tax=Bacillus sp. THAF10 TaxID=2587848 RepID=UPI0012697D4F|nr:hypothetical protein [Bacillus sp. THAF10]QFT87515.1 hypothetical protein FIU87_02525 [Bacillus sp. THAF10]